MRLLHVWPIGFFLLIPAILLLYLLKQRANEKRVSSLYLWKEAFQNVEATTPWERLKKNLLMILQILATLLLVVAMMGPYLTFGGNEYDHVVLLIDNSGSMNALYDTQSSRLETAKSMAVKYVEGLKRDAMVTVISCEDYPSILATNRKDKDELKRVLLGMDSTCVAGDMTAAVTLAASMMAEVEDYQAVIYTDDAVTLDRFKADVVDLSSDGVNGTVDYVSHTDHGDNVDVLAKVSNTGTEDWASDINLYLNDVLMEVKEVRLAPGESEIVYFQAIGHETLAAKGTLTLEARIQEKDALNEDNVAYDHIRYTGPGKALLITEQNVFLEKAILSSDVVELYKATETDVTEDETFDLILYDGMVPDPVPEHGNLIFINPDRGLEGFFEIDEVLQGVNVQATGHEVTKYIENLTFGLNECKAVKRPEWASSFLQFDGYSAGFIGNREGRNVAVLTFDIHQTDLPLQTEFPILMHNLLNLCVDRHLIHTDQILAGENVTVYPRADGGPIQVETPDGKEETLDVESPSLTWEGTRTAGLYRFMQEQNEETIEEWLAVSFPKEESIIRREGETTASDSKKDDGKDATLQSGRHLDWIFLILVWIVLLLEWIVYMEQGHSLRTHVGEMGIRIVVVAFLLLGLIDPVIKSRTRLQTTVFLVDVSDSTVSRQSDMEGMIRENTRNAPKHNQVGIVAFGSDSKVEQFVTEQSVFQEFQTKPVTTATNIEQALQAALALFPEKGVKRLVLITDGKENAGSLSNMESNLRTNQVEVMVWKLEEAVGDEVYVSDVRIPDKIRVGDAFTIQVNVESNASTNAVIRLLAGTDEIGNKQVSIEKGTNTFLFQEECEKPGVASYRVLIEPVKDSISVNNEYAAFTQAEEGDAVLLIEGDTGKADEFVRVLEAANVAYKRILPDLAPEDVGSMNAYSCVVLLDVYADDLTKGFLSNIETYVKDYAGGVIAIGGENSFALGNYNDTPLETILPVNMDLEGENEIPTMAIAMVVDHSGSMGEGGEGVNRLDLAKEAAVGALKALRPDDLVGVLAFDDTYDWVVGMQKPTSLEEVAEDVDAIPLGGGTSIYPALEEARAKISEQNAKIKHIILLTDGQDGFRDYEDVLKRIDEDEITLSTVAVGEDADVSLLEYLAENGGGRSYHTDLSTNIPRIFMKEVFLSAGEYLKNKEFYPEISFHSEIIQDVVTEGLPSMLGYVASTIKPLATAHLVSDEDDPILTTWRFGLGKTAAFNSDGENKWTAHYANWEPYPALWRNLIDWCVTDKGDENSNVQISQSGNRANVRYVTKDYSPASTVEAVYTDDEGNQKNVKLEATAPGTFEADVELERVGVYSLNVTRREGGEAQDIKNTAMALQYSAEYRFVENNEVLEELIDATGGTWIGREDSVFTENTTKRVETGIHLKALFLSLAALLLFFDIANRRVYPSLTSRLARALTGAKEKVAGQWEMVREGKDGKTQSVVKKAEPGTKPVEGKEKRKELKSNVKYDKRKETKQETEMLDVGSLLDKKSKRKY